MQNANKDDVSIPLRMYTEIFWIPGDLDISTICHQIIGTSRPKPLRNPRQFSLQPPPQGIPQCPWGCGVWLACLPIPARTPPAKCKTQGVFQFKE